MIDSFSEGKQKHLTVSLRPLKSNNYLNIRKTRLFKYIENFTTKNNEKFQIKKKSGSFHISAENIDCGNRENRLCEAVRTSTYNLCFWAEIRKFMYTPENPRFTV